MARFAFVKANRSRVSAAETNDSRPFSSAGEQNSAYTSSPTTTKACASHRVPLRARPDCAGTRVRIACDGATREGIWAGEKSGNSKPTPVSRVLPETSGATERDGSRVHG